MVVKLDSLFSTQNSLTLFTAQVEIASNVL